MTFEIFKSGNHTSANGTSKYYSDYDLDNMVASYNPKLHEAPITIGHPKDNSPAFGWIDKLKRVGDRLYAEAKDLVPEFKSLLERNVYKKRSISLYPDGSLRHVAFLGGMPPAVKGLTDLVFNAEDVIDTYEIDEFAYPLPESESVPTNEDTQEETPNVSNSNHPFLDTLLEDESQSESTKVYNESPIVIEDPNDDNSTNESTPASPKPLASLMQDFTEAVSLFSKTVDNYFNRISKLDLLSSDNSKHPDIDNRSNSNNPLTVQEHAPQSTTTNYSQQFDKRDLSPALKDKFSALVNAFDESLTDELPQPTATNFSEQINISALDTLMSERVNKGTLAPVIKEKFLSLLNALSNQNFSEQNPDTTLQDLLADFISSIPAINYFSEVAHKQHATPNVDLSDFSEYELDPYSTQIHKNAIALSLQKNIPYISAVIELTNKGN